MNTNPKQKKEPTPSSKLEKEVTVVPLLLSSLLISAITGIITHIIPGFMTWQQFSYLAHTVSGIIFALVIFIYTVRHFQRTTGIRRAPSLFSGLLSALILYIVAASGLYIVFIGVTESMRWVFTTHIVIAYLSITFIVLHLLIHRYTYNKRATQSNFAWFTTITVGNIQKSFKPVAITATAIVCLTVIYVIMPSPYNDGPAVEPYELPYGEHPFRPSQTETTAKNHFIDQRQIANSNSCGTCHTQIYNEWQDSLHGQSASDPTYVTNVSLLAEKRGIAATRYCEGCHAPVALLSGQLTKGGKHGGIKNTPAFHEGVSCMSCHGIDRAVHLKGVASYEFSPSREYLFASSENLIGKKLHNFLIQIHPEEHRNTMSRPILKKPELCATCHVQFMDKDMNNWGWIKMQDEYSAWLSSHYSGQSEQTFGKQNPVNCQDCHFPEVKGDDPSANKQNRIISHRSLGANTAIPYLNNDAEQLLLVKQFLQSKKLSLTIEKPWRKDATHSPLYIDESIRARSETPFFFYLGEQAKIKLTVTNLQVGHNFPGGTTDINQAWIYFKVSDANNTTIYESGSLNENKEVEPSAYFYKVIPIDRHGKEVWRHDLFRKTGESYRNVIPAGGSDVVDYTFNVPYWAKGPLTVTALVRYRKFNQRYARWALKDDQVELPITDMARDVLNIPVYIRPNVEK